MKVAFVDSSVIVALALDKAAAPDLRARLLEFDALYASPLLEAEYLSACRRERAVPDSRWLDQLAWVLIRRSLRAEIHLTLGMGYVRGADCHHLATALYLAPTPEQLTFLTRDTRQQDAARALGFQT